MLISTNNKKNEKYLKTTLSELHPNDVLKLCDVVSLIGHPVTENGIQGTYIWIEPVSIQSPYHALIMRGKATTYCLIQDKEITSEIELYTEDIIEELQEFITNLRNNKSFNGEKLYRAFCAALNRESPQEVVFSHYYPEEVIEPLIATFDIRDKSCFDIIFRIQNMGLKEWNDAIKSASKNRLSEKNLKLLSDIRKTKQDAIKLMADFRKVTYLKKTMMKQFPEDIQTYYSNIRFIELTEKKIDILRGNLDILAQNKRAIEYQCKKYESFIGEENYQPESFHLSQAELYDLLEFAQFEDGNQATKPIKTDGITEFEIQNSLRSKIDPLRHV